MLARARLHHSATLSSRAGSPVAAAISNESRGAPRILGADPCIQIEAEN
jgi:hypothetical protein